MLIDQILQGIVDILEGVNNQPFDQVTLHTSGGTEIFFYARASQSDIFSGCTVPANRSESG